MIEPGRAVARPSLNLRLGRALLQPASSSCFLRKKDMKYTLAIFPRYVIFYSGTSPVLGMDESMTFIAGGLVCSQVTQVFNIGSDKRQYAV